MPIRVFSSVGDGSNAPPFPALDTTQKHIIGDLAIANDNLILMKYPTPDLPEYFRGSFQGTIEKRMKTWITTEKWDEFPRGDLYERRDGKRAKKILLFGRSRMQLFVSLSGTCDKFTTDAPLAAPPMFASVA